MLQDCAIDFLGSWEKYMPLIKFTYDNNFQSAIGMAQYEALYSRKYYSPVHWDEVGERQYFGLYMVDQTTEAIKMIKQQIKTPQSRQKSYTDKRR